MYFVTGKVNGHWPRDSETQLTFTGPIEIYCSLAIVKFQLSEMDVFISHVLRNGVLAIKF